MKGRTLKRGDTWSYVVDLPPHPDGRRRQRMKGGFPTRKAAELAKAEEIVNVSKGTVLEPGKQELKDYLVAWLEGVSPGLSKNTVANYGYAIILVNRHIGGVRVSELQPGQIQRAYQAITASGKSPRTVKLAHGVLRQALEQAVDWNIIGRNPAARKLTLPSADAAEKDAWTAEEVQRFLASVSDNDSRLLPMWHLFLSTGLRKGELLGLRWEDVDLESRTLTVRQALVSVKGKAVIGPPKTQRSRRTIPLMLQAGDALLYRRHQQEREREAAGTAWQDSGLVFTTPLGGLIHPQNLRRAIESAVKKAGVRRLTPHGFRHTFASVALASGIHPKIVQEMLGHASSELTMDVYSHTTSSLKEDAIAKIGEAMFKVSEPTAEGEKSA